MKHTSEYQEIDSYATLAAKCAIDSQTIPLTIHEICSFVGYPQPVSEDQLRSFKQFCDIWSIRCNIANELVWTNL